MRAQLDDIMLQVNRIINRYQGDIELNTFRKKSDSSFIDKDFKKNRVNVLEEIYQHMQSADIKERILSELLSWLEEWHSVLSEATISEDDETDYYHWISDMEALPQALSATELNINSLIAFSIYFLRDKKRFKKRLASRGTMWKSWREKVLRKPSAGSPLKPEQMIKEETLTNNKVSEILGMLQELISSNMFNKGEINAIKYISSTAANLHKALGFQNQEIKNLIFQCTIIGSEIKEYYGLEKQTFQRTIQILSDKNEALEKELQNQEEKCMELLQAKANLEHQLSLANAGANLPSEETIRKRKNVLLKVQKKIRQEFEETVSSEETSQIDLPSVPEYQEVSRSEPSSRKLARGTGIKWESSKDKGDLSLDSKSSSSPMPPTSKIKGDSSLVSKSSSSPMPPTSKIKGDSSLVSKSSSSIMPPTSTAKTPIKSSKDASEDRSRTPSPEIFSPTRAPAERTKLPKPKGKTKGSPEEVTESKSQESKGENGLLTDGSKRSRRQELRSEPPARKRRKEIQPPEEDKVESVTKLDESRAKRKKPKEGESPPADEVSKTTESPSFEEVSIKEVKSDRVAKQKATKKGKGKKEKTAPEAYQNDEQQILQEYEKALMSFLQQKIDSLGKGGSKSEFKELVQPNNPETQKSLKTVRGKMDEYFQKMAEILTNILKKYREKKSEKPGDPTKPAKKGSLLLPTPQALLNLSEKMDATLSNMLKVPLSVVDNVKEEAEERGGKARRERKEQEDKPDTELGDDQSFPKHHGMQFIKQLQEERRLWKETQEQIQRKLQQENAWFQRQDEKRRWELKQRQWQAEEELWLEMQRQRWQQEKEHEEKQKQWEMEAAQHQMPDPQELERWKEQIAQKYQEQVELQLQKMGRQEEELQKLYPENFKEWRKVKQQMEQEQQAQRLSQPAGGPQTQEPLTVPPEGEENLTLPPEGESPPQMMMPAATCEVTPGQDVSGLRGADLPGHEGHDESYPSPYPPPGIPTKLPILEPQPGAAPGETPVYTTAPQESPISWAPRGFGEGPGSWGLPTPTTTSRYPTTSGEARTSGASSVPGETLLFQAPVAPEEIRRTWSSAALEQPPTLRPPLTTGQLGQPLPPRLPAIPSETTTLLGPATPGKAPVSWATPHFGPLQDLEVLTAPEQLQMSWVPTATGQLQTSWAPAATAQPQMSWASAVSGQPQVSWASTVPGQPQMSWAPAVSEQPQTSWAPEQPQVSWSTMEPQQVAPTPVAPGQFQASWDSRQSPTPVALAALGEPSPSVTFAAPGEPIIPVALAALGEPSIISVTYTVPGQPPTPVVFAAPGLPPILGAPAVPGQPPTPEVFAAPGLPPIPVAPAVPGQPPTPAVFAAPGLPPILGAPAVPGQPPTPAVFAAPGQPPIPVAPAVPGQPPTPAVFAAPGLPPIPVAPAVPGQPPTPAVFAAPGLPPIPVAPAVPGQPPTPAVFAGPGLPPIPVAPAVPGQPPTPVVFAGPGLPPIPVAPAVPGQPTTPVAPPVSGQPPTLWHPAAPEETYVPQFTPSLGQMVPPGQQLLKPLVPDSCRQSLTTLQLSALEKLSPELTPPTSLKPFLGPPSAPKSEMPLFLRTSGKPPTEWSPGILKRTQPHTPEEETDYKALSPQPPFIAEHSFPAVKFSKSPLPPSAQFLQISQFVSPAHISPKVCLPPIDNKLLRSPSFIVTEKSKMTVSPPCPRDFFASAPPPEESRYFIDIEGQRKNLMILSRAVEGLQLPLILYDAVKELINKTHYSNLNRLGCLFRKYIAYRLIQSAR